MKQKRMCWWGNRRRRIGFKRRKEELEESLS